MPSSRVSTPARASASRSVRLALLGGGGEALAEALVVGVDDDLLAGLGVLHRHQADVGQVHLERVEQAHRRHLVALRQLAEGASPSPAR